MSEQKLLSRKDDELIREIEMLKFNIDQVNDSRICFGKNGPEITIFKDKASPSGLSVFGNEVEGDVVRLNKGMNFVGRLSSCDVVVSDPTVSREQCMINVGQREVRVSDCGSLNGTYLA